MSSTNGAPAANNSGQNSNLQTGTPVFTTPVRSRGKGTGGATGGASGVSQPTSSSQATTTSVRPDSDPGSSLELTDLPFLQDQNAKPLIKPTGVIGGVSWDGTSFRGGGDERLGKALEVMAFWKRLAKLVQVHKWNEGYTWLYVTMYGTTGTLAVEVQERCANVGEFQQYLTRRYLSDLTVAELTAPVYQVAQRGRPIALYAADGARIWRMVADLISSQERNSVQLWIGKTDQRWAQRNQAVLEALKACSSWEQVENVLAERRQSIWDDVQEQRRNPAPAQARSFPASTPSTTTVAAQTDNAAVATTTSTTTTGTRSNRNGPGCWKCGSPDHRKRDCPKVTGRNE